MGESHWRYWLVLEPDLAVCLQGLFVYRYPPHCSAHRHYLRRRTLLEPSMAVISATRSTGTLMVIRVWPYSRHIDAHCSPHILSGPLRTSVSMYPVSTDSRVINTTQQLPSEFPFNRDYNGISGNPIGVGKGLVFACLRRSSNLSDRLVPSQRTLYEKLPYTFFSPSSSLPMVNAKLQPSPTLTRSSTVTISTSWSTHMSPSWFRPALRPAFPFSVAYNSLNLVPVSAFTFVPSLVHESPL